MNLRQLLSRLAESGRLTCVEQEVNPRLQVAGVLHKMNERPVLFSNVKNSEYRLVAGLCSDRDVVSLALGVPRERLLFTLAEALRGPVSPDMVTTAPCQEVVEEVVDLSRLPILTHLPVDPAPYVTAAIAVIKDPELGRNICIHRMMQLDATRFAVRLVEGRGTHTALSKTGGELEIAFCIGNSIPVLVAAAMSPTPGVDEFGIANALGPTPLVKCKTVDLEVPADCEIVLEGRITPATTGEGPFLDLTETLDIVRQQPVVEITCITHRREPIYQALLPGGLEHKLLMGMPREPTIFEEVSRVCDCVNAVLTPGGASWLHAVVQIRKRTPEDGRLAIDAAFRGHGSLKHVLVVDEDIDVYDLDELEWAVATRAQADRDVVILSDQRSSSLDPSALHRPGAKSLTSKMGIDATIPWTDRFGALRTEAERAVFRKVPYPDVDPACDVGR